MAIKKILLVDDSIPFNFLSKITLKDNGIDCQVDEALNGQAALEYLTKSEEWPDIILLDIRMPVMDGFEFLEQYQKLGDRTDHTKVFMLSSSTRDEDVRAAMNNPLVQGYFDKPLDLPHINEMQTWFK